MPKENSLTEDFNPLQVVEQETGDIYAATLMRNKVSEIIGSYHHDFDHFYECVQNAIDSCEKTFRNAEIAGKSSEYTPTGSVRYFL